MPSAIDVACEFLRLAQLEPDEPEPLTPMRLHKLVYYAQGWSLAFRNEPLFDGRIEAWVHGPALPELSPLTRDCGAQPVPAERAAIGRALTQADAELVEWVWRRYGCFSASELRNMTHRERPWLNARAGLPDAEPSREPLRESDMRAYFEGVHREHAPEGLDLASLRRAEADAKAGRLVARSELRERCRRVV